MLTKAAEQDRLALMEYCLVEPNINLFILGDIEHFGFDSSFQEVWFQTQAGQICAVALRYHDSLIIYSRDGNVDHKELRAILDTRQIRVISGSNRWSIRSLPLWAASTTGAKWSFASCKALPA